MFLTVYEADHIVTEGYTMEPITEGFLVDVWKRVVEIFKKIWDKIVKTAKAIRDFLFKSRSELDAAEKKAIEDKVRNERHEHVFVYDHQELINKFDFAYNAFNDLIPVAVKLKEGSKNPDKFDPESFKSQNGSTLSKWCNVEDTGETLAISLDRDKIAPIQRSNKPGTISYKEADAFSNMIDHCSDKYKGLKDVVQKLTVDKIKSIIGIEQYKNTTHFIRGAIMTLSNVLMTLNASMEHTLHCMVSEFSACTKDLTKNSFVK